MAVLQVLLCVVALFPSCCLAYSGFYCDCSPFYYTCFDVTTVGLDPFPLFGQPVDLFELDIRGLLKGYTATDYYYEYTKFVPYLLDDAVIGSVSCAPAKTDFDSNGLLPFIAAAASNTTVLAEGFANFLPTAAIEFRYENILTWKQALRLLNKTVFHPRVDGLETLLMNMTDVYSDLEYKLPTGFTFENVTDYPDFPVITRHIIDHYGDGPIDISDVDTTPYNFIVFLGTNGTHTVLIYDYHSFNGSLAMLPLGALPSSHFPGAYAAFQYPPGNYYLNDAFVFQGTATIPGLLPATLLNHTNTVWHDDAGSLITGAFVFRVDELSCFQEDEYFCITDYPRNFSLQNVTVVEARFIFVEEYFEDLNITYAVECSGPSNDFDRSNALSINFFSAHQLLNSSGIPLLQGGLFNPVHVITVTGLQRNTEYNCTLVKRFDNGEFPDIQTPQVVQFTTLDVPCPCLNGGKCLPDNYTSLDEITCSCPDNSTGEFCQQLVCPCMNGGACSPENFTEFIETVCVCSEVYTGELCESKIPCPCENGGVCMSENYTTLSEIVCSCAENYTGERCEFLVCPCMNGGACNPENFMAYNETVCSCPEIYTGDLCERRVPCPCLNGGMCLPENYTTLDEITCSCPDNSTGELCQQLVCPCMNGGACSPETFTEFIETVCVCAEVYTGELCESRILCPCENGGVCMSENYTTLSEIVCSCAENYTGERCEFLVCPCMNGGVCNPENFMAYNETVCSCPEVYTGDLCERRVPCPCENGGSCVSSNFATLAEVECTCDNDFTGRLCQSAVFQASHTGSITAGVLGGAGGLLAVVVLLGVLLVVFMLQRRKRKVDDNTTAIEMESRIDNLVL